MSWLVGLKRYRDERDTLIQLRHDVGHLEDELFESTRGVSAEDYQYRLADYFHQMETLTAAIAEIETNRVRRRADYWRVPMPLRPYKVGESDEFWEWHDPHQRYYISDKGHSQLRREIHQEWEMWSKPWLSMVAIGISSLSLAISLIKW
ncbi:hypothetical protein ELH55_01490 [Rhizobium ruizarguesonis]|jgi:hypothetical protein|uniref:hypothetical protein n=1 Tax=Rhizobium ruizarguesonis TaxID=2081791 RepID=UPI001031CF01|nr:hypothetical protein [Rhizobium ruizarguesonis]TBB05136.1 hypothetical protein ELH55_01490 [Rhizobium ruizarguesonis]